MRKQASKIVNLKNKQRHKRRLSIRKKINGTSERLRLVICKSNANLLIQAVDDLESRSLFTVSTFGKNAVASGCNMTSAKAVGLKVANELKNRNLSTAVFDRAGYKYTGVIAALVDSIRENGISL
jgi:large subunit ribosomal protein L18